MTSLVCPLCSQSSFDNLESLRVRLVTAATQSIYCPVCQEALMGLDKFTIHLFGHTLSQESAETPSLPEKQEISDDPLCTVNMEDLNFLTSWDVCCRTANSDERTVSQHKYNGIKSGNSPQTQNLNNSTAGKQCSFPTLDADSSNSYTHGAPEMVTGIQGHQQELRLEIRPELPKNVQLLQAGHEKVVVGSGLMNIEKTFAFGEAQNSFELEGRKIRPPSDLSVVPLRNHKTEIMEISGSTLTEEQSQTIAPNSLPVETDENLPSCKPTEVSPDFLSMLSKFRQHSPAALLQSSSQYTQDGQSMIRDLGGTVENPFEESKSSVTLPSSPEGGMSSSPGNPSNEVDNRELSEYMSELFQKKLPTSNFVVSPAPAKAKKTLCCELCGVEVENGKMLSSHMEHVHAVPDPYPCKLCGRGFRMRGSLLVHTRVAHGGSVVEPKAESGATETRQFHCSQCTKSFKKEQHLTQHMKTHDGKQWQCETCSKFFTTKYFLKKHQRLHTGEMPYACETCKKTFTFQQSYHKHLLYHSADKPHECAECGRAFKELSTLHNHQRIHSGEKPFACEACGKCFRQRVSYIVHQRIHTGVLPYQCTACKKKFRYKVSQRSHKCTAQPPGVVVRQPGDLIQRILEHRQNILHCLE